MNVQWSVFVTSCDHDLALNLYVMKTGNVCFSDIYGSIFLKLLMYNGSPNLNIFIQIRQLTIIVPPAKHWICIVLHASSVDIPFWEY